jgi:hypothetical protein
MEVGKTKMIKHKGGLLLTFIITSAQTCHNGRKEAVIFIYGYESAGVLPPTCLSAWCMLPLLALNTRADPPLKFLKAIKRVKLVPPTTHRLGQGGIPGLKAAFVSTLPLLQFFSAKIRFCRIT